MLAGGAFTVLLSLMSGVSAGVVLPPTDVTLNCTNLNVTVSWKYRERQPQTTFRVAVAGSEGRHYVTETTDHQYSLSHFIWESEESYLDFYYVNVTAIEGGSQSKSVTSNTLTFNKLKYADITCRLDFPPAELNERATVSFKNPLHYYRDLTQADKPHTVKFIYSVLSDGVLNSRPAECTEEQEICKHDVSFPEGAEKCVNLSGWLNAGNNVGGVVFRDTGRICLTEPTEIHAVALTIMLFVLAIIISVIIIIICKVKAWTMKVPSLPVPLIPEPLSHRERDLRYAPVSPEDISPLSVAPLCKNPSVSSEEENHLGENLDSSAGSGFRHPDGSYMEGGLSEGYNSTNSSVKTETVSINLEEEEEEEEELEEVSPYDCPHTLQVDMGDGDMVTGYSKR